MASLQRVLRPATRRLIAGARPAACMFNARWQSSSSRGPIDPAADPNKELEVGELQGAKFKIEPLRRVGEDAATMRARLIYQSRKRGTLESDLLLSTFASEHLPTMSPEQMKQYDLFLDENDWDIYYWVTQEESADGASSSPAATGAKQNSEPWMTPSPRPGEWAQTIGTFKPAYRPVPARWKDSEILALLRRHVRERSASGVLDGGNAKGRGEGMAFMPPLNHK